MRITELETDERALLETKRARDVESWGRKEDRTGARDVDLGEQCYLMRRRKGMTVHEVADACHVSHVSIIKRERNRGEVNQLALYWGLKYPRR